MFKSFGTPLRSAFRAGARSAPRQQGSARFASSSTSTSGSTIKGDLPWIIGSVAVFGPTIAYLTTPNTKSHHVEHHTKERKPNLPSVPVPEAAEAAPAPEAAEEADSGSSGDAAEAGEGKPLRAGDKHLRELAQGNEEHHTKQTHSTEAATLQANPHKMQVARDHTTAVNSNEDSLSTKNLVAEADTKHHEEKEQKEATKQAKKEETKEEDEKKEE